jgi:glycosyltransferase involved in cell wall biosynthesis
MKNKKRKKILYVITKSNWGGAQRYVYDLATNLSKDEFESVVAAGGGGMLFKKLSQSGIRTISIPYLERNVGIAREFRAFKFLLKTFREEKPDVIHLNSAKASGLGALAGRIANVPNIVQTVHGWSFNEERSFLWRTFVWIASWTAALLSHKSIMVSRHDFEQAKKMPFIISRVSCIQNAISGQTLMERDEARSKLSQIQDIPKGSSSIWVGTNAELHKNKGLKYGINAIKLVLEKNSHVYWIVISDGEEKKNLVHLVKKSGLQKHIFFLGYVDNAAQYMKAFDIFMLPSVKEGLPYVLLEARAAGIPIVSTDVGGIPEVVLDTSGIIVPPKNPEKLAEAIEVLLSHKINLEKGGEDFNVMLKNTITLY